MKKNNKASRISSRFLCVIITAIVTAVPAGAAAAGAARTQSDVDSTGFRQETEYADVRDNVWDKIRKRLPEIDFAEFDKDREKEKLREAIRTMDDLGISPEMLVKNAWSFINRKENREKIDKAVDGFRDKAEEIGGQDAVDKVRDQASDVADQVTKEVTEKADEKIEEAADKAKNKAEEEILNNF